MRTNLRFPIDSKSILVRCSGLLVALALMVACTPATPVSVSEVRAPVRWGAAENVAQLRHLWISDQPDAEGFSAAAKAGVEVVIDLRAPGERDWDEEAIVKENGLVYYNVPVAREGAFSRSAFEEIERVVKAHKGEPILLHCSSGNRAAAWLTTHLVTEHEMPFESALEIGQRTGITKRPIVEKVADYLGETAPAAAADETLAIDLEAREKARALAEQLFGALPSEVPSEKNPITEEKVALGRMLYYEPRISKNHDISCNSCHSLANFGVDNEPTSPGHRGQRGERNSPTVFNAALHVAQFWDGRAVDVEEQAKGPIQNPVEMAMAGGEEVIGVLRSIPGYEPLFRSAFPGEEPPITFDNVARAIGAFERRLVTPSRFDDFLRGDLVALSDEELAGMDSFVNSACITCHMGPGLGGQIYQKLGVVHPYETEDLGRQTLTGRDADRHVFKVPSLRNIAETGPYFHDGSVADLDEVIRLMAWHQLGRELSESDSRAILVFLETLTGEIDPQITEKPQLPERGPDTPGPDPS